MEDPELRGHLGRLQSVRIEEGQRHSPQVNLVVLAPFRRVGFDHGAPDAIAGDERPHPPHGGIHPLGQRFARGRRRIAGPARKEKRQQRNPGEQAEPHRSPRRIDPARPRRRAVRANLPFNLQTVLLLETPSPARPIPPGRRAGPPRIPARPLPRQAPSPPTQRRPGPRARRRRRRPATPPVP